MTAKSALPMVGVPAPPAPTVLRDRTGSLLRRVGPRLAWAGVLQSGLLSKISRRVSGLALKGRSLPGRITVEVLRSAGFLHVGLGGE